MSRLDWHYGPTEKDADRGKRWHRDCGGEVLCIDDGLVCSGCGVGDDQIAQGSPYQGS